MERRLFGKNFNSLMPETADTAISENKSAVVEIPISEVKASKYQPRVEFNQDKLADLINSIREKGIVQPVLVRRTESGYELIAGERRMRAAQSLGMALIPAIIREASDIDMLEIALIENIQREDLNPMEEARAYHRFIEEFGFSQEKISKVIGKDRSTVANSLRLLSLPRRIQEFLSKGSLTTGHAKALMALPGEGTQLRMADIVIQRGLSVRETENLIARKSSVRKRQQLDKDPHVRDLESDLQQALGTKVTIYHGKKRGRIEIEYYSLDDLERVTRIMGKK